MSNGVYVLPSAANGEVKPVVSSTPLVDFLMQLEDYTPTVGFPPKRGQPTLSLADLQPHPTRFPAASSYICFPIFAPLIYPLYPARL